MNGIPVYPMSKNGERPYLAPRVPSFLDLFFGHFWYNFNPTDLVYFISA